MHVCPEAALCVPEVVPTPRYSKAANTVCIHILFINIYITRHRSLLLTLPAVASRFVLRYALPMGFHSTQTGESMHKIVSKGNSNHQWHGLNKYLQIVQQRMLTTDYGERNFPQQIEDRDVTKRVRNDLYE